MLTWRLSPDISFLHRRVWIPNVTISIQKIRQKCVEFVNGILSSTRSVHFGGLWESAVKSMMKRHLMKTRVAN